MSKLAVLIPYYNGKQWINRCIKSLQGIDRSDIFVIDNSEIEFENTMNCQLITSSQKKIGFARAVNLGLEHIYPLAYDFVLILNQDAYFAPGHFKKLMLFLDESPPDRILSPLIYTEDFNAVMPFIQHRYFSRGLPQNVIDIPDFVAVSWVAPVHWIRKLNGFDESYFMYYEDNDLLKRSGMKNPVRIVPQIHVAHRNEELKGNEMSAEKKYHLAKSHLLFLKKHGSQLQRLKHYVKYLLNGSLRKPV